MQHLICNPGQIFLCWSGRRVEDIYKVAKFNFNFHNSPNQEVQQYTTHDTTISGQKSDISRLSIIDG